MNTTLRKIHLASGLILLVIFPLTGAYMRFRIPHLMEGSDRLRFSLRGNHIYILFSALMHLSLGVYFRPVSVKWAKRLQVVGSALLIQSSAMVVVGFFFEPKMALERPVTLIAMVMALVGMLLHLFCGLKTKDEQK